MQLERTWLNCAARIKMKRLVIFVGLLIIIFFSACSNKSVGIEEKQPVKYSKDLRSSEDVQESDIPIIEGTSSQNVTKISEEEQRYIEADTLFCQKDYKLAGQLFYELEDYKDSAEKAKLCENYYLYDFCCGAQATGDYNLAYQYFLLTDQFLDSEDKLLECTEKLREETIYIERYLWELNHFTREAGTAIYLKPTLLVNMDRVDFAGIEGTVTYKLTQDRTEMMMIWTSNQEYTDKELVDIRDMLKDGFSYGDCWVEYDDDYQANYIWTDVFDYDTVLCTLENNHLKIIWLKPLPFDEEKNNSSGTIYSKKTCEDCDEEATKTLEAFGVITYLCDKHYNECMDIIDMMETDVGKGTYSIHHCEECNKEGTRSIIGISGKVEYYCTEHYNEMVDLWESLQG